MTTGSTNTTCSSLIAGAISTKITARFCGHFPLLVDIAADVPPMHLLFPKRQAKYLGEKIAPPGFSSLTG